MIAFDRVVYRKIQVIALTLMTSSEARAPELTMMSPETPTELIKHHSNREQTLRLPPDYYLFQAHKQQCNTLKGSVTLTDQAKIGPPVKRTIEEI